MHNDPPLHIMHAAAPGLAGGLESVLIELTTGLRQRGHVVLLAAVLDHGVTEHPVTRRTAEAGVDVERIVVPPRAYVREYATLRRLIRSRRPDLVHTHGYRADLLAGAAARHEGVPWISTVHGFTGGGRKNRLYEWLQVRAYRQAQGVVAVSRPLRDLLERRGVPGPLIQIIPNAWMAKPVLRRDEARRALAVSGEIPLLGWVGRLSREKGADVFLEALAFLADVPWRASILGVGREQAALEAIANALGIAKRITWHGMVPEAARCFPAFDLFILSSRTEGTPIALFEAMASEVPIVATAVGGVPDVVSTAEAALVPPEDPRALAAAMRAALVDPEAARRRAVAARQRLQEHFSTGPWLDAHERMYRHLASPPTAEA
jgi:glycosyltransferase involved in cell wall biosynthesis